MEFKIVSILSDPLITIPFLDLAILLIILSLPNTIVVLEPDIIFAIDIASVQLETLVDVNTGASISFQSISEFLAILSIVLVLYTFHLLTPRLTMILL